MAGCSDSSVPEPALQLSLQPPADFDDGGGTDPFGLALAPDGRRLVIAGAKNGVGQLWLRDLTTNEIQPLPGSEGGLLPFWKPDGSALGFFASGKLRVYTFVDRTTADVADAPSPAGAAWRSSGAIVFAPRLDGGLQRRTARGTIEPFTTLEAGAELGHRHPRLSTDGELVLFFVHASEPTREGIWIAPYDEPSSRRRLVRSEAHGLLIDRTVLYASESALVAQTLDDEARRFSGTPLLIGTPVGTGPLNELFATEGGDVLLYGKPRSRLRELRWVDRSGQRLGVVGEPMDARDVRIGPSAAAVAVSRVDPQLNTLDIWIYEGDRPLPRRMSLAIDADETPVWPRDGQRIGWVMGRRTIVTRDVKAQTSEASLRKFGEPVSLTDWSHPQWMVASQIRPDSRSDVVLVPAHGTGEPRSYAASAFSETYGAVSPSQNWLAYASDESGRYEIYVDSFPTPGRRARLTVGGATEPRWAANGREIYFRRGTEIHVVRLRLDDGGVAEATSSERLFDAGGDIRSFDVSPDGTRFLLNVPAPAADAGPMTAIVHIRSRLSALAELR